MKIHTVEYIDAEEFCDEIDVDYVEVKQRLIRLHNTASIEDVAMICVTSDDMIYAVERTAEDECPWRDLVIPELPEGVLFRIDN